MRRVLEIIFRRPLQLLLLIAVLPMLGLAVAYFLTPLNYECTASLWALRRYEIIGATGPESDLQSTPAQTQATALAELLKTRVFDLTVANATDLASTLDPSVQSDRQKRDNAMFNEIALHVQVVPVEYNLFSISYANHNPAVAQQVVKSVIESYGLQSLGFSAITGKIALEEYSTQLVKAQQDANTAAHAEAQYRQQHPNLTQNDLLNDPQYALLQVQTQQAQTTLGNIKNQIATINQEISLVGTGADSLYKVLDVPAVPDVPQSRLKQSLYGGGTGLGVALLACILYVIIVVRRDRAVYTASDLQRINAHYPVAMQLPVLSSKSVQLVVKGTVQDGTHLLTDGASSVTEYARNAARL